MKKRTGIYGGSFNPIHNGHTELGTALCRMGLVDELWFMVSPLNPLKTHSHDLLDDAIRLQLAQLAVKNTPHLHVSDFEMHMPKPSYMVDTLAALRQSFPDREFVLVIGADNWSCFSQWRAPEEIMRHHQIIIYPRTGHPIDETSLPNGVTLARTPIIDISSTDIRKAIVKGNFHGEGLSPAVWQKIKEKEYFHS